MAELNIAERQVGDVTILDMDGKITIGEGSVALRTAIRRLLEEGILISAIRPPTVPTNTSRLRIAVTAKHAQKDLEFLVEKMTLIGKELCLI